MVAVAAMAVVAAAEAAAGVEVAATGLEVAATAGSVDAEVAAGSEVAAASEVAGAAAAGSVVGGAAAFPGVRAACAKCHDLTAGLTEDAVIGLGSASSQATTAFANIVVAGKNTIAPTREPFVLFDPRP